MNEKTIKSAFGWALDELSQIPVNLKTLLIKDMLDQIIINLEEGKTINDPIEFKDPSLT